AAPVVGRIDGTTLSALGDLVERYDARGARLTAYQKLVVIGVAPEDTEAFADDLEKIDLDARPSNWRRSTMACTGIEFCKLAIVAHKNRAIDLVSEVGRSFHDPRHPPRQRVGAPLPRPRHPDHHQRQRLPQRLRPNPGRRHRPQGHAGA